MAINTIANQKKPKKLFFTLMIICILGWAFLFTWVVTQWFNLGFNEAYKKTQHLLNQQTKTIELNSLDLREKIKNLLPKFSIQRLSFHVSKISQTANEKIHTLLPLQTSTNSTELTTITNDIASISQQLYLLLSLTIEIMLIKSIILMAALPLFIIATIAGLIDGLNQRAIRTASLGRESSYLFHQLNRIFKKSLMILLILWLAMPISISPALVFIPASILLSIAVSATACRFKKYL